jgi:hypothetical protein
MPNTIPRIVPVFDDDVVFEEELALPTQLTKKVHILIANRRNLNIKRTLHHLSDNSRLQDSLALNWDSYSTNSSHLGLFLH